MEKDSENHSLLLKSYLRIEFMLAELDLTPDEEEAMETVLDALMLRMTPEDIKYIHNRTLC